MKTNEAANKFTTKIDVEISELFEMHPTPWERRGRAIFDSNAERINIVDPKTLELVVELINSLSKN